MQTLAALKPADRLPVTRNLTLAYGLSLVVAVILAAASLLGLLNQTTIYPTDELRETFVANDLVNLFVGLPILLGSMWLARRGRLVGLLFWPGATFFVFYNAIIYVFALPLNEAFLLNILLVALSGYATAGLAASIDGNAVREALRGAVPERAAGGVLIGLGLLFSLQVIGTITSALSADTQIAAADMAVHVADFVIAPAWVIGGLLLWRREAFGYVTATGLLFQGSMLFVGLIAFLLLQPVLTEAEFAAVDLAVVSVMGLICFIPFGLFVRGAWSEGA
jgi:hypothetical protein